MNTCDASARDCRENSREKAKVMNLIIVSVTTVSMGNSVERIEFVDHDRASPYLAKPSACNASLMQAYCLVTYMTEAQIIIGMSSRPKGEISRTALACIIITLPT